MKIFKRKILKIYAISALCLFAGITPVNAETLIVVNSLSPFKNLTESEARRIWLGRKKRINGIPLIALGQIKGKTQSEFYRNLFEQSSDEMNAYWKKMVFKGMAFAPEKLKDDEQVKEWLAMNPLAIGYINADSLDASVRVLLKIKSLQQAN